MLFALPLGASTCPSTYSGPSPFLRVWDPSFVSTNKHANGASLVLLDLTPLTQTLYVLQLLMWAASRFYTIQWLNWVCLYRAACVTTRTPMHMVCISQSMTVDVTVVPLTIPCDVQLNCSGSTASLSQIQTYSYRTPLTSASRAASSSHIGVRWPGRRETGSGRRGAAQQHPIAQRHQKRLQQRSIAQQHQQR